MPTVVLFTSRSAGRGRSTPRRPSSRRKRRGTLGRAVPDRDLGRPGLAQRPDRRARCRRRRARARMPAGRAPSAAIRPGASVLSASIVPSGLKVSVLAAPIARAAALALVGERERGVLVRHRHVGAERSRRRRARGRSRRTARAGPAAAGSSSRSRPSAASAARCIAGERLWRDRPAEHAQPALACARATGGAGRRSRRAPRCRRRRRPGTGVGRRERELAAAVRLGDVVEVGDVRGWAAATIDASPGLEIGVGGRPLWMRVLYGESSCRSAWDSSRQRLRESVEGVEQRRVDPERHAPRRRL